MPRFRRIAVALAALLTAGCYDSRFGEPDGNVPEEPATETIAALRARYAGTPFTVTGDIVVAGTVTTSDRAENFTRFAKAILPKEVKDTKQINIEEY